MPKKKRDVKKKVVKRRKKVRKTSSFKTKNVRNAFKLPIQTVTLVPSTKEKSKKISSEELRKRVEETRMFLSRLFGGFTSVRTTGGYVYKGKVIKERVVMVTAYAERLKFKKHKSKWLSWVRRKKKTWSQDSMGIIIENDLFYV